MKIRGLSTPTVRRVIDNLGWLMVDKILRLLSGLFIGVWVARHLGVESFGVLNYALSFVGIFAALASLGLNGLVVRELVRKPDSAGLILGSSFILLLVSGVIAFFLMSLAALLVRPDSDEVRWLIVVVGAGILLKSFDVIRYWYEAEVSSKFVVWMDNLVFIICSGLRVALILFGSGVLGFALVVLLEAVLAALGLVVLYLKVSKNKLIGWNFNKQIATNILSESWPLALSVFAIVIYTRVDQLMIGHILGDSAVGEYSAALRLSEVWYFIPAVVTSTAFPLILNLKLHDESKYDHYFQLLYDILVVSAILIGILLSIFSKQLMYVLYGEGFVGGAEVLIILAWTGIFVSLNTVSGRWLISEGLVKLALFRNLIGAALNILLNLLLIPRMGIVGAAVSTLISYGVSAYVFDVFTRQTRKGFAQKTRSLMLFGAIHRLGHEFKVLISRV